MFMCRYNQMCVKMTMCGVELDEHLDVGSITEVCI